MRRVEELLNIAKEAQLMDCDSVFVISGKERIGKSTLLLHCIDFLKGDINGVACDKDELGEVLVQMKDCSCLGFDEAGDGLFSRDAQTKFNKDLVKLFMVIGQKRIIAFLVLPNFFLLDSYFRKHRVVGMFFVYKRGHVCFFDRKGIKKINFWHEKSKTNDIRGAKARFLDTFPMYKGPMLQAYKLKKDAKVNAIIEDMRASLEKKNNGKKKKE